MIIPNYNIAKKRNKKEIKFLYNEYHVSKLLKEFGKGKTYFVRTYGCQMNVHDSENIRAILEDMSFKPAIVLEEADLIILNTCAIRENAHNKVFGMLGRIKNLKNKKKNIIVGIAGCMSQEEVVINEIITNYKWIDFVFGTHNLHQLPQILEKSIKTKQQEIRVWSKEGDIIEGLPVKRDSKYKAWVNIMYGCDKFCTYCIVPFTRGKQRSRKPQDIINEVKELKEKGYKEVTLLGQNVNAYGKDFKDINYNMEDLLIDISKTNIDRIRFLTSHPWDFTDGMIKVIKERDNIMPYFHLPIQSGSSRILKLMGRRYTKEEYLELFNKIKKEIPNATVTTDIIVGFPGEEEVDFKETLDVVNKCKFDTAYTFIYSKREGTPAAKMKDNITLDVKKERLERLNKLVNKYAMIANDKLLNKEVLVLIEGYSEKDNNLLMGYTDTFKLVNVVGKQKYIGKIVKVKINEVKTWSLNGEIINE